MKLLKQQFQSSNSRGKLIFFAATPSSSPEFHQQQIYGLSDDMDAAGKSAKEVGSLEVHETMLKQILENNKTNINKLDTAKQRELALKIKSLDDEYDKLHTKSYSNYNTELADDLTKLINDHKLSVGVVPLGTAPVSAGIASPTTKKAPKKVATVKKNLESHKKDAEESIYKAAKAALKKGVGKDGLFDQEEEGFEYVHLSSLSDDVEMDMENQFKDNEIKEEGVWDSVIENLGTEDEDTVQAEIIRNVNFRIFHERAAKSTDSPEATALKFIKKLIKDKGIRKTDKNFNIGFAQYILNLDGDLEQDVGDLMDKNIVSTTEDGAFLAQWEKFSSGEKEFIVDYLNHQEQVAKVAPMPKKVAPKKIAPKKVTPKKTPKTTTPTPKKAPVKKPSVKSGAEAKEVKGTVTYTVKPGDTLGKIGSAYGVDYKTQIFRKDTAGNLIKIDNVNRIYVGEKLYIVGKGSGKPAVKPGKVVKRPTRPTSKQKVRDAQIAAAKKHTWKTAEKGISKAGVKSEVVEAQKLAKGQLKGTDVQTYQERVNDKVRLHTISDFKIGMNLGKGYEKADVSVSIVNGANTVQDIASQGFLVKVLYGGRVIRSHMKPSNFSYTAEDIGGPDLAQAGGNPFIKYMKKATLKGQTPEKAFHDLLLKNSELVAGELLGENLNSTNLDDSDANLEDAEAGKDITKGTFVIDYLRTVVGLSDSELRMLIPDDGEIEIRGKIDSNTVEFGFDWTGVRGKENILRVHKDPRTGKISLSMHHLLGQGLNNAQNTLLEKKVKELEGKNGSVTDPLTAEDVAQVRGLLQSPKTSVQFTKANMKTLILRAYHQNEAYHKWESKLNHLEMDVEDEDIM